MATQAQFYYRDGSPVEAGRHVHYVGAAPVVTKPRQCGRCGGAGGSDKWQHTGWTCFDCGGNGTRGTHTVKVYGADRLARLNQSAAKRQATKAAKAAAAEAERKANARTTRRELFAQFGSILLDAWRFRHANPFLGNMVERAWTHGALTDGQIVATHDAVAREWEREAKRLREIARKAAARHVGAIGERIEAELTLIRRIFSENAFGPFSIKILRDAAGNSLKTFGKCGLAEGETARCKFTVKAHERYNEEPQTVITRISAS